jgi:hypothetical protein
MQTVADIFAIWPSDAEFGRDLGVAYATVASWKQRASIPAAYWQRVTEAARRRGHPEISAEVLTRLHAHRRGEGRPSGFAEEGRAFMVAPETALKVEGRLDAGTPHGHFSRWKHLRRSNFTSPDEIAAHIGALREEWARR